MPIIGFMSTLSVLLRIEKFLSGGNQLQQSKTSMSGKLRNIVIGDQDYVYTVNSKYDKVNKVDSISLRAFLKGNRKFPLEIEFVTKEQFIVGSPLFHGVDLFNTISKMSERVNINQPGFVRQFILLGIENGWTGKNKIPLQNGMGFLRKMGYILDEIQCHNPCSS
ncbi:MAG: hypothetical protein J7578_09230 [Chitinophagaceae bacterium]|nr:hypothetical protein [Chitinophagaceae bacterium]